MIQRLLPSLFSTLTSACMLMPAALWAAPSQVATDQVTASLVASAEHVQPGGRITLGLHQKIIPHWHTYWQNPGDSGVATAIEWSVPAGAEAGDIQWPIPKRFNIGPVTNFGYENAVTLLTDIRVPTTARPGEAFAVEAQVNWLVCHEVCIPQKAHLALSLPVVAAGSPPGTGNPLIDQARASLPTAPNWAAHAVVDGQRIALQIPSQARTPGGVLKDAWFYPQDWGRITHNAPQTSQNQGQTLLLATGESPAQAGQALSGVLVLTEVVNGQEVRRGYSISPPLQAGAIPAITASTTPAEDTLALGPALLLAFLGGLILNLMPCVFPVLSIKALSLLHHHEQSPAQARWQGVAYTLGVLASFALLATLLLGLKAGGAQVGWGFQFQSPVFVLAVAYLMLAVGLNLSGLFTIGSSVTGLGSSWADRGGYSGSFFTGVLATVVATPCTAPFMGGAVGFALTQPAPVLLAVFLSLGLGLAAPYLLLSCWPALQRWLPSPGAWMGRFKQALAFPMYAAAAWLVWVLAQQAGANAVGVALLGMVAIGFAAWVYDASQQARPSYRLAGHALALAALTAAFVGGPSGLDTAKTDTAQNQHWEPYTPARLSDLRAQGKPVFLNLTAAWCITCLANERVALSQEVVTQAFKAQGIAYLKGDWTKQDPHITQVLSDFGRSGVPLYVYYPPGAQSQPVVLPQILTPDIVVSAIKDAPVAVSSSQP